MEFSVNQIAAILNGIVDGNGEEKISTISKIQEAEQGAITFLSNPAYENYIYSTNATAIIVSKDLKLKSSVKPALIKVDDPYLAFTSLLEEYNKIVSYQKQGVEEPSFLGANTKIGSDNYRGAFSYIGNNVTLGNNVKIYPHAYIGDDVTIGDNCIIYSGVRIYHQSVIGNNCIIHAGSVIGSDGFGFAPQQDGSYKKIPQLGIVVLEDNVEIGSNTVVDRATMGKTLIQKGVKLDNLIQIGHNVEVGENTVIAAQSGISGSTKIGKNCMFAGQVGVAGHAEVADKVTFAAQAGVAGSVKEAGAVLLGAPAIEHRSYLRSYAIFRKLPDLAERVKQLEKKVLNLPAN